jgi:hypothetical protein
VPTRRVFRLDEPCPMRTVLWRLPWSPAGTTDRPRSTGSFRTPRSCDRDARFTCRARTPSNPPGEGEISRESEDACDRTGQPRTFVLGPRPRAVSVTDSVRAPRTPSPDPVSSRCRVKRPWRGWYRASPRMREAVFRLPRDRGPRCCLPIDCYPRLLRAPASRRFPCDVHE